MKKDAFYFSHDANARNDINILQMRSKYGLEGYGIFWCLIEKMREEPNHVLALNRIDGIALGLGMDKTLLKQFVQDCIEYGLFKKDRISFWSDSFLRRMQIMDDIRSIKSERSKIGAEARWKNTSRKEECYSISALWQTFPVLIQEKSENLFRAYGKARSTYTHEQIEVAIKNYAKILSEPSKYFFQFKWTIEDFLMRTGVKHFHSDECFTNFIITKKGGNNASNRASFRHGKAEIENLQSLKNKL